MCLRVSGAMEGRAKNWDFQRGKNRQNGDVVKVLLTWIQSLFQKFTQLSVEPSPRAYNTVKNVSLLRYPRSILGFHCM